MINIRYCKNEWCKKAFDMGDYEICPECRGENLERQEDLE